MRLQLLLRGRLPRLEEHEGFRLHQTLTILGAYDGGLNYVRPVEAQKQRVAAAPRSSRETASELLPVIKVD